VAALVRRAPGVAGPFGRWEVETDEAVWAAAPGQACVFYDPGEPDAVIGGGRISRPEPATARWS
jgi:hypothetical protein